MRAHRLMLLLLVVVAATAPAQEEPVLRRIEQLASQAATPAELAAKLVPFLGRRDFAVNHSVYTRLIAAFEKKDVAPLVKLYARSRDAEQKIWLAAAVDYCGSKVLLKRLRDELPALPLADRHRAAICVCFKLGDPKAIPHLIEAMTSNDSLHFMDVTVRLSAEYLLQELTNHVEAPAAPDSLWNFQCFVMPPPVCPYPMPTGKDVLSRAARESLRARWLAWWKANRSSSRLTWVRDGVDRDVAILAEGKASKMEREGVEYRLHRYLTRDWSIINGPTEKLVAYWAAKRKTFQLPKTRLTK